MKKKTKIISVFLGITLFSFILIKTIQKKCEIEIDEIYLQDNIGSC